MAEALRDLSTEVVAQTDALEAVSLDVRARVAAQILLGVGSIEEVVTQLAEALGENVEVKVSEEGKSVVEVADDGEERVLDQEMQTALLVKLKTRFEANMDRHEDVSWDDLQRSLEADPEKLWSLHQMEEAGHEPDVYIEDDGAYYYGTCCLETREAHRNIVFDAAAQELLRTNSPHETCNGNAVDIAAALGIELMDEAQYRHLQTLGEFDAESWSWIKTLDAMRESGFALCGSRFFEIVFVREKAADELIYSGGLRGSLRVSKV